MLGSTSISRGSAGFLTILLACWPAVARPRQQMSNQQPTLRLEHPFEAQAELHELQTELTRLEQEQKTLSSLIDAAGRTILIQTYQVSQSASNAAGTVLGAFTFNKKDLEDILASAEEAQTDANNAVDALKQAEALLKSRDTHGALQKAVNSVNLAAQAEKKSQDTISQSKYVAKRLIAIATRKIDPETAKDISKRLLATRPAFASAISEYSKLIQTSDYQENLLRLKSQLNAEIPVLQYQMALAQQELAQSESNTQTSDNRSIQSTTDHPAVLPTYTQPPAKATRPTPVPGAAVFSPAAAATTPSVAVPDPTETIGNPNSGIEAISGASTLASTSELPPGEVGKSAAGGASPADQTIPPTVSQFGSNQQTSISSLNGQSLTSNTTQPNSAQAKSRDTLIGAGSSIISAVPLSNNHGAQTQFSAANLWNCVGEMELCNKYYYEGDNAFGNDSATQAQFYRDNPQLTKPLLGQKEPIQRIAFRSPSDEIDDAVRRGLLGTPNTPGWQAGRQTTEATIAAETLKGTAAPKPQPGDPGYAFNPATLSAAAQAGRQTTEATIAAETLKGTAAPKPQPGDPGYAFNPATLSAAAQAGRQTTEATIAAETLKGTAAPKPQPGDPGYAFNPATLSAAAQAGRQTTEATIAAETLKGTAAPKPQPGDPGYAFNPATLSAAAQAGRQTTEATIAAETLKGTAAPKPQPGDPGYAFNPATLSAAAQAGRQTTQATIGAETLKSTTASKPQPGDPGYAYDPSTLSAAAQAGRQTTQATIGAETLKSTTASKPQPGDPGYAYDPSTLSAAAQAGRQTTQATIGAETLKSTTASKPQPGDPGYAYDPSTLSAAAQAGRQTTQATIGAETLKSTTALKPQPGDPGYAYDPSTLSAAAQAGRQTTQATIGAETLKGTTTSKPQPGDPGYTYDPSTLSAAAQAGRQTTQATVAAETVGSHSLQDQLFNIVDGDFPGESDGISLGPTSVRKSSDGTIVATPYSSGNLLVGQGPRTFSYGYSVSNGTQTIGGFVDVIPIGEGIFAAKTDSFGEYRLYNLQNGRTPISSAFAGTVVSMQNGKVKYRDGYGNFEYIDVSQYLRSASAGSGGAAKPRSTTAANTPPQLVSGSKTSAPTPSQAHSKSASATPSVVSRPVMAQPDASPSPVQQTTQAKTASDSGVDAETQAIFLNAKQRNQALIVQQQQLQDRLTNLNQQIVQTGFNELQLPRNLQAASSAQSQKVVPSGPINPLARQHPHQGVVKPIPPSGYAKPHAPAQPTKGTTAAPILSPTVRKK